jgi:hypothetical protein
MEDRDGIGGAGKQLRPSHFLIDRHVFLLSRILILFRTEKKGIFPLPSFSITNETGWSVTFLKVIEQSHV